MRMIPRYFAPFAALFCLHVCLHVCLHATAACAEKPPAAGPASSAAADRASASSGVSPTSPDAAATGSAEAAPSLSGALLRAALELLAKNERLILDAMATRAIDRGLQQTEEVRTYVGYVPFCALLIVPLWLWRRRAYRRARERGVAGPRILWRAVVATALVTSLLWGFIQIFMFVEEFKRYFSWTSPAQGLASNALTYLVEHGDRLAKEGSKAAELITDTVRAVASGERNPEAIFGHLFENAQRFKNTWVFRWGYQLYTKVFPLLEYFGTALLFVMFVIFLRFSVPGMRELLSHVSGEGPPGVGFGGSLWRHLRTELVAMAVFLIPYLLVTTLSFFVTWIVTSVAAQGLMDNTVNALAIFYTGDINPALVVANFVGIAVFVFEVVILLLVATALILSGWLDVLHEKFPSRHSFCFYLRFYLRFAWHSFRVSFRLYLTLLVPALLLAGGLEWLGDEAARLGPAATLLVPAVLVVVMNVVLWLLRLPRGLRNAIDKSRWRPKEDAAMSATRATQA